MRIVQNKPLPPPPPTIDILDISMSDAEVLMEISRYVGGSPDGPRGAIDRLRLALKDAGVKEWNGWTDISTGARLREPETPFKTTGRGINIQSVNINPLKGA